MTIFARTTLLAILSLWAGIQSSSAQDADVLVAAGRFYLTKHDLPRASGIFQQAADANPANHQASALSALARLAAIPYRPAVSNFLDRLTVPKDGRDIYGWTAKFPTTADGKLNVPSDLQTSEAAALLRSELLSQIGLSIQDLSRITDQSFTLNLTKEEIGSTTNLTIDLADLRLCRAMLEGIKVGLHAFYPWDLDTRLSEITDIFQGSTITAEELLNRYPTLFATFQASDGTAARAGFQAGVESYNEAIGLIQQRPTNVVRLFNLSRSDETDEWKFRVLLNELKDSLLQPTVLSSQTNLTVSLADFFSAKAPLRSYLPTLKGDGIISGSWPDINFGGILIGANLEDLEASYPPEYVKRLGNYRSSSHPLGIQVVGNRAFVANGDAGLLVLDISNPSQPTRLASLATTGQARGIQVVGNYAYTAHVSTGLQIFDVSNPTAPVRLGGYDTPGQGLAVVVSGTTALIADGNRGVQLVDVSNPADPVSLGSFDTPGNAEDIQVKGSTAFVADGSGGLRIVDFSDPNQPTPIGIFIPNGSVHSVHIVGDRAFLAADWGGLVVVDISNPTAPRPLGSYATDGSARGLDVFGDYVFMADW